MVAIDGKSLKIEDVVNVARHGERVELAPGVHSVCVHGDTPGAVAHARAVRAALEAAGWRLEGLGVPPQD